MDIPPGSPVLGVRPADTPPLEPASASQGTARRTTLLLLAVVGFAAATAALLALQVHSANGQGRIPALLAVVSIAGTVAYLAMFIALHLVSTGFDPVRHAVSDYAVGRYGLLFRCALYTSSLGVLALAFALARGVGSPPLTLRDLLCLLLIPLTRVGMALFPTDLEGHRLTRTGLIHYVFAISAFTFTYLAISGSTPVLVQLTSAPWIRSTLHGLAWAVTPALVLVVLTMVPRLRRVFGLFERLFLLTTNCWFVLAAVLVVSRAG